jgi:hypothetical protein
MIRRSRNYGKCSVKNKWILLYFFLDIVYTIHRGSGVILYDKKFLRV